MMKSLILVSTLLVYVSSCGRKHSHKSNSPNPAPSETNPTPVPSQVPAPMKKEETEINFSHEVVLREFANGANGNDRAALFIVKSSAGAPKVTEVTGPTFLSGAHVGVLSKSSIEKIFTHSAYPLSSDEKSKLLSKFEGDIIVYFEDYAEPLCAGPDDEHKVNLSLDFSDRKIEIVFQFSALQSSSGNCTFIKKMFLAAQNTGSAVILN